MTRFSDRHGVQPAAPEVVVRDEAPHELRGVLVDIAYECGLDPHRVRSIVCRVLRVREDPDNWSAFPNVDGEVRNNLDGCQWYEVYDVIEAIAERLKKEGRDAFASFDDRTPTKSETFASELNAYFVKRGIGWQLRNCRVESRGPEAFEAAMTQAAQDIGAAGKITARAEIHEALRDLSRRPEADLTGALHHALAALECVAREVSGDSNATLGAVLSRNKDLIPPPLNVAVEKMWGFASEYGRHVKEGRQPPRDAVELVVHVAAAVGAFLVSTIATAQQSASTDEEIPF